MTRHKKFLKAEKARKKLKGSQLPKGLNVTKTEFKVRKIVIPEQLRDKSSSSQVLSRKRLSVKDCLLRLSHNNPTHRAEALKNLREIVEEHFQEISEAQLGQVFKGVAELVVDIERDNRREACRVLNLILSSSNVHAVEPFFDILCSYLRCAMTHITQNIQEDSLLFLDVLLMHVPRLVAMNRDKILPNFMDMISKLRTEAKPERTLTVHLGSKITGVKWRTKVLERLYALLVAINSEKRKNSMHNMNEVKATEEINVFEMDVDEAQVVPVNYFDQEKNYKFPIIFSYLEDTPDFTHLLGQNVTKAEGSVLEQTNEGQKIESYVQMVMPLMFETWLEVKPSADVDLSAATISLDAAYTLKLLLQVTLQLWCLVKAWDREVSNDELSKKFKTNFSDAFLSHFLEKGFPFNQIDHLGKKRLSRNERELARAGGVKCWIQNLMICQVFTSISAQNCKEEMRCKVINYLKLCVRNWDSLGEASNLLNVVLKGVFLESKLSGTKDLLKSLITCYLNPNLNRPDISTKILLLLCNVILDPNAFQKFGQETFQQWIKILPKQLLAPVVSQKVIDVFTHLCRQMNRLFQASLEQDLIDIVQNISKITVIGALNELEGRKAIASLVYWTKDQEKLLELHRVLNQNSFNLDSVLLEYLKDLVRDKLEIFQ